MSEKTLDTFYFGRDNFFFLVEARIFMDNFISDDKLSTIIDQWLFGLASRRIAIFLLLRLVFRP